MRALIYVRVSTDEQAQSAETQERGALAWCAAQGHAVVETVRDVGYSGAEWVRRPGIAALQLAAASGRPPWDLVVVRDVDRLGRDGVRLPYLLASLHEANVQVVEYSTGQTVALDGVGQLVASVRACVAQIEREQIAHRTRTAHRQHHLEGRVVGGVVYGYRNVRSAQGVHYEVDETQAVIVREVFERAARGEAIRAIVHALNARKVPAPSAGRRGTGSWSPSALHGILRSERYRGQLVWGRTAKHYRRGTKARKEGGELVRVEDPALAIVTADVWEAAQAASTRVRVASGRPIRRGRPRHLLVGHARCAACGGPIATGSTRQGSVTVPAYHCGWHKDRGTCPASWRRWVERMDSVVRSWLLQEVLDEGILREAVDLARERLARAEPDPRVLELRDEERALVTAVTRLVSAIEAGADVHEVSARLQERRARLEHVRQELSSRPRATELQDVDQALALAVGDLRAALERDVEGARGILAAVLLEPLQVSWEGPGGKVWIEGRAELGGVLRAALTGGMSASPAGFEHTPRFAEVVFRRAV